MHEGWFCSAQRVTHLLFPLWCPGCGEGGVSLCTTCATELNHWFRAEADSDALPAGLAVWAAGAYAGVSAKVIMAWKSGHRPDLAPIIESLGASLGRRWVEAVKPHGEIWVVPAPSGWRRKWSGNEVVAPLAEAVVQGLTSRGAHAVLVPALHRSGGGNHHLSRDKRLKERAQAISIRPHVWRKRANENGSVLLVDDVLTTGATLAASARAAAEFGPVLGAIVLTATPKPVHFDPQNLGIT